MKNKIVKIVVLALSGLALSGCSSLDVESEDYKEAVESAGYSIASSFLDGKVEILNNLKVNTEHKPYMSDVEIQSNKNVISSRFSEEYYPGRFNKQCIHLLKVNPDDFEENTTLRKPDSSDTCQLNKTRELKGVYNINRGYAVFRQVQILCESDEYYIVQSGDDYGLSNYDHIALTGKDVHEGDVIS